MAQSGCCSFVNYVPPVVWFADSIPYGVGCATLAGPREPAYNDAIAAGTPLFFAGTQSNAGFGGGLTADPFCECYPGIATTGIVNDLGNMVPFNPRIVIYSVGVNDVIASTPAATIAANISAQLDTIKGMIRWANYRIILTALLKNLDGPTDAGVQAVNALLPGVVSGKSNAKIIYVPQIYDCIPNPTVGVNMHDTTHPNDVGATFYGNALWNNGLGAAVAACRGVT